MSGRRLIAIVVGIVGLILLIVIAFLIFRGDGDEAPPPAQVEASPAAGTPTPGITPSPTIPPEAISNMVDVVVAWNTVPRGFQMTEAELAIDKRLASEVGSNVITNIDDAVGLYARREIYQGETLTSDSLVKDPTLIGIENYGPSSLVPPGWVALAVPLDRLSSVAYGISPGDTVDIMLSFTLSAIDEQFQTLLFNSAVFFLPETGGDEGGGEGGGQSFVVIDPYGRFEQIATGDIAHVAPAEVTERPIPVSVILQGARVIQVGPWRPSAPVPAPTPTQDPEAPTPTPGGGPPPTPTPPPPDVVLLALPPQQQLFLKYALEVNADIDYALRGVNDPQLYAINGVDFEYILGQFDITIPPNSEYSIGGVGTTSLEAEEVQP